MLGEHSMRGTAGETCWPGAEWDNAEALDEQGWSLRRLNEAFRYADTIATDALMVVQSGRVLAAKGDTARRINCHSIRKSFLSALVGIYAESGAIDLSATLAELKIDDREGLSEREKSATVYDLLTARSGIYHPAGYESPWMRAIKPPRHSQAPGTAWCYSNWDFNALGTIFTDCTGIGIHAAFEERIARPIGCQDFRFDAVRQDGWLQSDPCSDHPAYPFTMSARDLARFGLLYLRDGVWRGRQVVPAHWVAASVLPQSEAGPRGGYGYMWWTARHGTGLPGAILPEGTFSAQGVGGQYCVVLPALDLVVVHRVDTSVPGREVDRFRFGRLLDLILRARRPD